MRSWELTTALFLSVSSLLAPAQGTFQNLNFESAQIVSAGLPDPSLVQFAPAFPGWSGGYAGLALYNSAYLDTTGISIIDQSWPHLLGAGALSMGTSRPSSKQA